MSKPGDQPSPLTRLELHTISQTRVGSRRRPIPSPLQESTTTARSISDASSGLHSPTSSQRLAYGQDQVPTAASATLPGDRVRAPNPAKRAPTSPAIEEFRQAVTRDALREEAKKSAASNSQSRKVSAPVPAAAPQLSPPTSPTMISSVSSRRSHRAELRSIDGRPIMPRNASIDSTVSSLSTATTSSQKPNGSSAYRVAQEGAGAEDVVSLIAAAGSPEGAIQKLIGEKNQAASHNAQLWRLVEKQRAMILGLNKDLEKILKEKERYRKKLKDHLVQSQSAPMLTSAGQPAGEPDTRESSQSPALVTSSAREVSAVPANPGNLRGMSLDSRKFSDTSDVASVGPGRSDTPQDSVNQPSSGTLPGTPQSANSGRNVAREVEQVANAPSLVPQPSRTVGEAASGPTRAVHSAKSSVSSPLQQQTPLLPAPSNTWSSPKAANRKAPPAPLQLSPKPVGGLPKVTNNVMDASDSEYEDDPASARSEHESRGRRKTREEDDREREALAVQEMEARSQSRKKGGSKSKTKPAVTEAEVPSGLRSPTVPQPTAVEHTAEQRPRTQAYQVASDPVAILRQRAQSDAAGMLPKSSTAPSLLSPGLPMSPRPSDKPLNSPMPRALKAGLNGMPMSPKSGLPAGLPLSPRAPRQPLPMPPQTPLTFASPHLARAEMYHQQAHPQQAATADSYKPSPQPSPDHERPSTSSDPNPKAPGEVYKGLIVEQYPDLLLPPNALPSIYIKTSSSRMKPSRQSYIAPKQIEGESPVLTLAVYERSDSKQLWRVEKTVAALVLLDAQIKSVCPFRDRLPDKAIFSGHSPAKIDARRAALDVYFDRMLDSIESETAAKVLCKFLSKDVIGADAGEYFNAPIDARPDTPVARQRPQRAGYLTKRGKNFGGWKARYFVLDGPQLKYFEAPGGAHLGSIKLQNAQIGKQSSAPAHTTQEDEDNQFRHAFLVLEPKRKDSGSLVRHVLCAESDEERDAWVEALLQYVDFRDDEEDMSKGTQYVRPGPDISGARSPRLQKSMNDLRPPSRSNDSVRHTSDAMRAVNYNDTRPGEAPVLGAGAGKTGTPSPPHDGSFTPIQEHAPTAGHPAISGPTNLHVISNAGDWGMRPPPTPQSKDHAGKDKKRSMFAAFRGRSSSDLVPSMMSPAFPPSENRNGGTRAVFGVPLAEAVEFARPADVSTELPAVVYRCIEYLTVRDAITEEGIFRLSGSSTVIKQLRERFNTEGDVDLVTDNHSYDIHAVAGLLKLYLRELPSSILTRELHLEFLPCLELHGQEKVAALNQLVNRLPRANRALLQRLSEFLLDIVNNADINKMNVRNVGMIFAPTLNVPAPLIYSFVEDQAEIFGPPMFEDLDASPISVAEMVPHGLPTDLRSPRKQMFSDLPTPAYHQTSFQSVGGSHGGDTGMIPMQPSYANYQVQMAPQGDGGFGSLNDALRSPGIYNPTTNGSTTPREVMSRRRESAMMFLNPGSASQKKVSMSRLRAEEGASF